MQDILDENKYVRRFTIRIGTIDEKMSELSDPIDEPTELGTKICGKCSDSIAENTLLGKSDACWLGWCKRFNIIVSEWDSCNKCI